jgi:hypothetical protein
VKVYKCIRRFFATPLKRYIPVGAHICRFEELTKIVISDAPQSDLDPFDVLADGIEYDDPAEVTWLYGVEPPPLGTDTRWFETIASAPESACGEGLTGSTGPQGPVGVAQSAVLSAPFAIPALCATGVASVSQSTGYSIGTYVYIDDGSESGEFVVVAIPDGTSLTLRTISSGDIGGSIDAGTAVDQLGTPATTHLDLPFIIPAIGASAAATMTNTTPYSVGEYVRINDGTDSGFFQVVGKSLTTITLETISGDVGATLASCTPVTHSALDGAQGPQGMQGVIGLQGFGLQGLQGNEGIQGSQGAIGFQGDVGEMGSQGAVGEVGSQGAVGFQGDVGEVGSQGAVGVQGFQGSGIQGFHPGSSWRYWYSGSGRFAGA